MKVHISIYYYYGLARNDRKTHFTGNIYLSFFLLKLFIPAKKLETLHAVFSSNILGNERERASFIGLVLTKPYNNFTDPLENLHTQMLSSSRGEKRIVSDASEVVEICKD